MTSHSVSPKFGDMADGKAVVPEFVLPPVVKRILEQQKKEDLAVYTTDFEYMEAGK